MVDLSTEPMEDVDVVGGEIVDHSDVTHAPASYPTAARVMSTSEALTNFELRPPLNKFVLKVYPILPTSF